MLHFRFPSAVALVAVACSACGGSHKPPVAGKATLADDVRLFLHAEPPGPPTAPDPLNDSKGVPEAFPKSLIPTGATVIAAAASATRTVVASAVPAGVPYDWIHFEWKLQDAGWVVRQLPAVGFSVTQFQPSTTMCKDGMFVRLTYRQRDSGERLVRAAISHEPDRSCAPVMAPTADMPVPQMLLPAGISSRFFGSVGGTDATETHTRLETTLSPGALAGICVPQLEAVGWAVEEHPETSGAMSVTRLNARSRYGDALSALLVIAAIDGDVRGAVAVLRVLRVKPSTPVMPGFPPPPPTPPPPRPEAPTLDEEVSLMIRETIGRAEADALVRRPDLPESFPRELLYPGSDVLAAAGSASQTVVISRVAAGAPFDPTHFEETIRDGGWLPAGGARYGFYWPPPGSSLGFCKPPNGGALTYRTLASGARLVRAAVVADTPQRPCSPMRRGMPDVSLPGLELPPGVGRSGGGAIGDDPGIQAYTRLSTTLSPQALLAHYTPQVVAAGWTKDQAVELSSMSIARFGTTSTSGQKVAMLLTLTRLEGTPFIDADLVVVKHLSAAR